MNLNNFFLVKSPGAEIKEAKAADAVMNIKGI